MSGALKLSVAAVCSFAFGMLLAPAVIKLTKKLKAGQVILGYVEQHKAKSGTPTMGGFIFILPMIAFSLIFGYSKTNAVVSATVAAYAVLGFLDDFIKIRYRQNQGLKAYQKLVGQLGIAVLVAVYAYKNPLLGQQITLPFSQNTLDLKGWYVPFVMLVLIASTNAVNLTDGLDGLAGSVGVVYFAAFSAICALLATSAANSGETLYGEELESLSVFCAATVGALCAFLWHNSNPAEIMMGDTGSLALGGAVGIVGIFTRSPFLVVIVGIMYTVGCISVIMQVIAFKLTGKRIFKMSPYHHHLEKSGVKEQKIVWWYVIVSLLFASVAISSLGV